MFVDLAVKNLVQASGGNTYMIIVRDAYLRLTKKVYFLRSKDYTAECFIKYLADIAPREVEMVKSDGEGEFRGEFGALGFYLFESHLRPMSLDVLGYQSLLQRCHPACDHKGYSHLSPVLALRISIAEQVQHF